MLRKLSKKILPVFLSLALVVPSVLGQSIPAVAASGNDGEAAVQTEDNFIQNSGGLEEGVYTVPLAAYSIGKPEDYSQYGVPGYEGWHASSGTTIGAQGLPAYNERAKVEVASGGAITLTLRIDSQVEYDAVQIMRREKSAEYNFGPDLDLAVMKGNAGAAMVSMGTFNLPEGYLADGAANPTLFQEESNPYYYQAEDGFSVNRNAVGGYTELSLKLASLEQLDRLVIKNALRLDEKFPVGTSFLIFQKENMVKIPSLEEFARLGNTGVQLSDLVTSKATETNGTAGKITTKAKDNLENLFQEAAFTVEGDKITVSGTMASASFEGAYALRHVRQYTGVVPASGEENSAELLKYKNPYYNTRFATIYNKYTAAEGDYSYSITFDYTLDNLIYGVPISFTGLKFTNTKGEFSDYTEEQLNQNLGYFARFHLLPRLTEQLVRYGAGGELRLASDTATLPENVELEAQASESVSQYETLYSLSRQKEDQSRYLKAYSYTIKSGDATIAGGRNLEMGIKVPDDWERGNNLYAMWFYGNDGGVIYSHKDGTLQIDSEGYAIIKTTYPVGELYLYVQETPEDLTQLEEGIYQVDVTAMHNSHQGRPSMSNNALVKKGVLKISKDQSGNRIKELYMDFKVMYIGTVEGHLSNVATADNYEEKNVTYGEVLDYFTVGNGEDLLAEPSYLPYGMNVYLAKQVKINLQEYNGSEENKQNYYPVYFEVPPMDADPTDGINLQAVRLMVSNAKKADGQTLPSYQKTVLKKALNEGGEIEGDMYTKASFEGLKTVLEKAQNAYDKGPSEAEILEHSNAIKTAISELLVDDAKKADKTELEKLLKQANSFKQADYTATSFENLKGAITLAQTVYQKEAARQSEVDGQVKALKEAIAVLVSSNPGAVAPNKLPDGIYTIPIRLWHAIKDSASMGDAALEKTGILTIEEGKATLQIEMKPLTFAGLTGYLMEFNILSDYVIGAGSGYPEQYKKNPAAVLESHDYVDLYNGADSKDERCKGKQYPKTLQFDVTLPEAVGVNYTWVHVYVPVMGELDNGDQEARLRLDYSAIAKKGDPAVALDHNTLTMAPGESTILTATLIETEGTVVWSSSNPSVAAVDNSGKVTAAAEGSAVITAKVGELLARCTVTVEKEKIVPPDEQNKELKNGTYSIPVSLWHAYKDQASMGNAALGQSARLVIDDGTGTLYINFQSMTYMSRNGYLASLSPSTVISTYNVVDEFNSETSTDSYCRGMKYPQTLAVPVTPGSEFVSVSVYVPVMGSLGVGDQDARLKLYYSRASYISSSTSLDTPASDSDLRFKDGEAVLPKEEKKYKLVEKDGFRYFYDNDKKVTSQMVTYEGKRYYTGEDGAVITSRLITFEEQRYYAGEDGAIVTSALITVEGKKHYAASDGRIAVSSMITYENHQYYADENGEIAVSNIVIHKSQKYYAGKDGAIVTSKIITHKKKKYYADKTGVIAASKMVTYKKKKYYADKTGAIVTSKMITYKKKKYYADKTGAIVTSKIITYKKKKYYVDKTGKVATSKWITIGKKQYYFDKTGKLIKTKNLKGR